MHQLFSIHRSTVLRFVLHPAYGALCILWLILPVGTAHATSFADWFNQQLKQPQPLHANTLPTPPYATPNNIKRLNDKFVATPNLITQEQEGKLAFSVLQELYKNDLVVDDPWLNDYLYTLYNRLHQQTPLAEPLAVKIIKSPEINAFAVPGGLIAVNSGLIALTATPDELASVLAHEIAHHTQRHYAIRMEQNKKLNQQWLAGLIASILLASHDAQSASALSIGTQALAVEQTLQFSREHERESDRIGLLLMQQAGFDVNGMSAFFSKMDQRQTQYGQQFAFLMTHPLSAERVSNAELATLELTANTTHLMQQNSLSYMQLKQRLQRINTLTTTAPYAATTQNTAPLNDALQALRTIEHIEQLLNQHAYDQAFTLAQQTTMGTQNGLLFVATQAALYSQHINHAWQWFERISTRYYTHKGYWQLRQQLITQSLAAHAGPYNTAELTTQLMRTNAELELLVGNTTTAKQMLDAAIHQPQLSFALQQQLRNRLHEIERLTK